MSLTRRFLLLGGASMALAACTTTNSSRLTTISTAAPAPSPQRSAAQKMYAAIPNERFPIPAADLRKIDPVYYRQMVDYATDEPPGTIIVDTPNRFLYLTMAGNRAMRYGVGIGRDGFAWGGRARIAWKKKWPTWTPPAEMIAREPHLEKYRNGMEPGLDNPLGARALYIFEGGKDTLYRVHGTQEEESIGRAVSSGCVRLMNHDVIDLYNRVSNGSKIVVYQEGARTVELGSGGSPLPG